MQKQQQLTQEQLNELKGLAKTKTLKAIANHFNMNKATFMLLRKEQPEIDAIYYETKEKTKNKLYTAEEILAIEEMARTLNMENIAKHLCISIPLLTRARNRQPELDAAIIRGIKNRSSNFNFMRQAEQKAHREAQAKTQKHIAKDIKKPLRNEKVQIVKQDSLFTRAPEDMPHEKALARFLRLKEEARERRLFQELRKIN